MLVNNPKTCPLIESNFAFAVIALLTAGLLLYTTVEVFNCKQDIAQINERIQNSPKFVSTHSEQKIEKQGKDEKKTFGTIEIKPDKSAINSSTKEFKEEIKFGIDDSGLKFNADGSIDDSDWIETETLIKFKYPNTWFDTHSFDGIVNTNSRKLVSGQVNIVGLGFSAPFDLNNRNFYIDKAKQKELIIEAAKDYTKKTKDYVEKYGGTCIETKIDALNIYMECTYEKEGIKNLLYKRTDTFYDYENKLAGEIVGLNIEYDSDDTLEKNKKILNKILDSAYIGGREKKNKLTLKERKYLK